MMENYLLIIMCLFLCFGPADNRKLGILIRLEYLQNRIVFRVTERIDNDLTLRSGELADYLVTIHTIHSYNLDDGTLKHILDKPTNKPMRGHFWSRDSRWLSPILHACNVGDGIGTR